MPIGYPNINIDFQISEAKDNSGDAGSTWCGSRWRAKGDALANNILYKWGFADYSKGKKNSYSYKCANIQNAFGLWNYAKNYKGKGRIVSSFDAREASNCEELEGAILQIESEFQRATNRVNSAGMLGGASAKNAKIDKHKWNVVRDFFYRAIRYQDGTSYNTCEEQASIDAWEAILAAQTSSLNSRPEGISNTQLAALIGGGAIGMILVVSKFVK